MNGVLLWIAGLLVALLGALFAVPYAVDWNSYRGVFEEEASRMLGREVRVGGNVTVRLLPVPYVSFERPRIADTGIGDAFFRAESFTMWLALPPLIQGIFEARQVELRRPALRLQVDREGGGNWQRFQISRGTLPFVPRGLALQSLNVSEGVLALPGVDGEELARIEIPDAELSAPALEGPYKVRADVRWNGELREVRVSTAAPDADGSLRLKTVVRTARAGNVYTFEGRLADLLHRPRLEGEVTATILAGTGTAVAPPSPGARTASPFEIRSKVIADALGARLGDVTFSFEQDGKPQLLTGTAEANWMGRRSFKANLSSRWLDLDRISGTSANASALEAARRLAAVFVGSLPRHGDVTARFSVDQANVAGDVVSGLVVALEDFGQGLLIKELRASLPGGSRVEFSGELKRGAAGDGLEGDMLLRGANLGRFLGWAARGVSIAETRSDAGFSFASRLRLASGAVEFRQAVLDSGANWLSGEVSYKWDKGRELTLSLETPFADLSVLLPGSPGVGVLRALLGVGSGEAPRPVSGAYSLLGLWQPLIESAADFDARVEIRADVLTDGAQVLQNVDAELALQKGKLALTRLRAATPSGFEIEAEGDVADLAREPKGVLRGVLAAKGRAAVEEALELAGLPPERTLRWLGQLAPLRLAFVTRFGGSGRSSAEVSLDGMVLGEPFAANLVLQGGFVGWREAPLDALLAAESAEVARLVYGFAVGGARAGEQVSPPRGRLLVKASGVPAQELFSLVQVSGEDLQLSFRGRGTLLADLSPRLTGEVEMTALDAARAVQFFGLQQPVGAVGLGLKGRLGVTISEAGLQLDASNFEVGKSRVSGRIMLAGPPETRRIDVALKADGVSMPLLIGLALDRSAARNAVQPPAGQWREEPFDFANLERVKGHIRLEADSMLLEEGFGLTGAVIEADLEPDRISITKLEGRALGGAVSCAFKLEKAPGGASLNGALGLWDIRLDQIVGAAETPFGAGRVQLTLQLSGQAVTPRALIPVLTGKGELEFKGVRIERLSPGAIAATADAVAAGRIEAGGDALRRALRSALAQGPLLIGSRKIPVELGEGALRVRSIRVETPDSIATNQTTIDIAELKIDSEWKLEPKPAGRAKSSTLPGISIVHVGPLASLASLEPRIVSDALERELAVRRMERDVEHLERLRREDEARARAEAERQRALELEHQGAGQQPRTIDVPFPIPPAPQGGTAPPYMRPQQQSMDLHQGEDHRPATAATLPPAPAPRPVPPRPQAAPTPFPTPNIGDQWPRPGI